MRQFLDAQEAGVRMVEAEACACPSWPEAPATRAWRRGSSR